MPTDHEEASAGRQPVPADMHAVVVRTKVWLEADGRFVMGEGALELFASLEQDASLTRAAAKIGWSYRHAWGYVREAERALGMRLTCTVPGKGSRRGTRLTSFAYALLALLTEARRRAIAAVDTDVIADSPVGIDEGVSVG